MYKINEKEIKENSSVKIGSTFNNKRYFFKYAGTYGGGGLVNIYGRDNSNTIANNIAVKI